MIKVDDNGARHGHVICPFKFADISSINPTHPQPLLQVLKLNIIKLIYVQFGSTETDLPSPPPLKNVNSNFSISFTKKSVTMHLRNAHVYSTLTVCFINNSVSF